jgi:hypothetical protein
MLQGVLNCDSDRKAVLQLRGDDAERFLTLTHNVGIYKLSTNALAYIIRVIRSSISKAFHMIARAKDLDTALTGFLLSFLKIAEYCRLFSASLASGTVAKNPWREGVLQIFFGLRIRDKMLRSSAYETFRFINNVK